MKTRIILIIIVILSIIVAWVAIKNIDEPKEIPNVRIDETKPYVEPFEYDTNFDGKG